MAKTVMQMIADYGEENILALIENGYTIKRAAKAVGVDGSGLWRYWNRDGTVEPEVREDRKRRWEASKKVAAEFLVDDQQGVVDALGPDATSEQVQAARIMSDSRRWRATRLDPAKWGDKQQITHQVSLQVGHLNILRERSQRPRTLATVHEAVLAEPGPDYEILEAPLPAAVDIGPPLAG